jgi:hypothetical protein
MEPGEYAVINQNWRYISYSDGEELYNLNKDPNEWDNLANDPKFQPVKDRLKASAPTTFAKPEIQLDVKRDLVIDGDTFHWEPGANMPKKPRKN